MTSTILYKKQVSHEKVFQINSKFEIFAIKIQECTDFRIYNMKCEAFSYFYHKITSFNDNIVVKFEMLYEISNID